MPIALNRACKLAGFFLGKDKEYIGRMHVHNPISQAELQKIINEKFLGKIKQTPPKRSKVKRVEREREIKRFEILEQSEQDEKDFLFITEVQGGTYIRKLVYDLGLQIGGAHMLELRRTRAGIFSEDTSMNLYDFKKAVEQYKKGNEELLRKMLIPAERTIKKILPFVQAKKESLKNLLTGKPILKEYLQEIPKEEMFAVFSEERFIEIAKKTDEGEIIAKPMFVLN